MYQVVNKHHWIIWIYILFRVSEKEIGLFIVQELTLWLEVETVSKLVLSAWIDIIGLYLQLLCDFLHLPTVGCTSANLWLVSRPRALSSVFEDDGFTTIRLHQSTPNQLPASTNHVTLVLKEFRRFSPKLSLNWTLFKQHRPFTLDTSVYTDSNRLCNNCMLPHSVKSSYILTFQRRDSIVRKTRQLTLCQTAYNYKTLQVQQNASTKIRRHINHLKNVICNSIC